LFQVKYTSGFNGYTGIAITKLDILDHLDELKIGIEYILKGVALTEYPPTVNELGKVEVTYKTLPGWKQSIVHVRRWGDLPENAKNYVKYMQDYLQVPVRWIGVGPGREAMIEVQDGEIL